MIIALGKAQARAVERAVDNLGLGAFFIEGPPIERNLIAKTYEAPYVGWERVKNELLPQALTITGGRRAGSPAALRGAIQKIGSAQAAVVRHPAMRGLSMLGHQGGWFPAFRTAAGWSPMPQPGSVFAVLGPVWTTIWTEKQRLTVWTTEGNWPRGHWLSTEAPHLAAAE